MLRRLFLFAFALALLVSSPLALARYSVCRSVYHDDCLRYRTCLHYDDSGNQTSIVWETYECP